MKSENQEPTQPTDTRSATGEDHSFQVELVGSSQKRNWILAAIVITAILFFFGSAISSSGVLDAWLPWTQEYAQRSIPQAPDGDAPIELLEFTQNQRDKTITVIGRVRNRTKEPIEDLIATLTLITSLATPAVEDVPLTPQRLDAGAEGSFEWIKPLTGQVGALKIKFKLVNGAVLQHKDSRYEEIEKSPPE